MVNENYSNYVRELDYYNTRINQLEVDRKKFVDSIIQVNISYEIRFCQGQIKRVTKEINRFKRIN